MRHPTTTPRPTALGRSALTALAAGALTVGTLAPAVAAPESAQAPAPVSWVAFDDASIVEGGRAVEILVTAVCAPGKRIAPRTFGITITQGQGFEMVGGTTFRPITCDEQPHTALMRVVAMDGRTFQPGPALGDGWVSRDDDEEPGDGRLVKPITITGDPRVD